MSRIRKGAVTAFAGGMLLVGALPVHASATEAAACQFLMPISLGDVTYCACVKAATVSEIVLPGSGSSWDCAPPR